VQDFVAEGIDLGLVEGLGPCNVLVTGRVLGDECALADRVAVFDETFLSTELIDLGEQTVARDADERVFDSRFQRR
jgi:hypothetical protein